MFPELFTIGGFTIYSYGVMLGIAFLTALYLGYRKAKTVGIDPQVIVDTGIVILIGALVGAKLFYILGHLPEVMADPSWLLHTLRVGGVFQGGLIVAVVLSVGYLYWKKQPVWLIADIAAPSVAIGQAIGRLGCFAAGCCYGKPVDPKDVPWAVSFGPNAVGDAGLTYGVFRHPTQIYEALLMVVIFAALTVMWRYRKFDGQIFWAYVVLYSIARGGIVEWFRGDHGRLFFGLSGQQWISIVTLLFGLFMLWFLWHRSQPKEKAKHPAK
jgi:phosphatidylglycerol:prolipoprotein diacylglycerol transferase